MPNRGNRVSPVRTVAVVAYTEFQSDPRVRREAEALAKDGYVVHVISVRPGVQAGAASYPMVFPGVRLHQVALPIRRGGKARYLYQYMMFSLVSTALLMGLYVKHRFAVVHIHSLPDFLVFSTVPEKLLGVRVVLDLHEAFPEILAARFHLEMSSPLIRFAQVLEWVSAAYADRVFVVSRLRATLVAGRGFAIDKVAVVSNAPDAEMFQTPSGEPIRAKDKLDGALVITEAGGINPERDLDTLVHAAGIMSSRHRIALLLFGKGDPNYLKRLRELAARIAPEVDFRLGGWIPASDVARYLAISEVGLATYLRNPLTEYAAPNKVFECVAARRPLVLADLKALRMEWEGAALFYEPGNAEDLATKIERLIGDPELARRLTAKADEVYRRNDWSQSRETLLRTFDDLTSPVDA